MTKRNTNNGGRHGVQEWKRRARAVGFVPVPDAILDNALHLCKLARMVEQKGASRLVVLDNSTRSTPGEARRARDIEMDRTNIAWTVVDA